MASESQKSELIQAVEEEIEKLSEDYVINGPNIESIRVEDIDSTAHHSITDKSPITSELIFNETQAEILGEHAKYEETLRNTARHEAAHSLHYLHLENNGESFGGAQEPRNIKNSYLEAFAQYEGHMREEERDKNFNESMSTSLYDNLRDLPDFWDMISNDKTNEPDSAHGYGRLAADLIEKSHLERSGLEHSQTETRRTLMNTSSYEDLEDEVRWACQRMNIPYFGDVIREERGRLKAYMEGEEYWEIPDSGFNKIMLLEGEDAIEREVEQAYETLEEGTDSLEEHYRANATLQVADTFGVTPETSPSTYHTNKYNSQVSS